MSSVDTFQNGFVEEFDERVKRGIINPKIVDLQTEEQQKMYQDYIDKIISLNPKEYSSDFMPRIDDFFDISLYLVIKIFGEEYIDDFKEIYTNRRIILNESKELFNGVNIVYRDRHSLNVVEQYIEIPNCKYISDVICLLHEFTHYICTKYNLSIGKKEYYSEILSIYVEKRALEIIKELNIFKTSVILMEESRLESIKWHYKDHLEELQEFKSIVETLRIQAHFSPERRAVLESLVREIPSIETPEKFERLLQYKENLRTSYGIGYLYSESLLAKYFEDFKTAHSMFLKSLKSEISLEELLKYYSINTSNPTVYDTVEKKLSKFKK